MSQSSSMQEDKTKVFSYRNNGHGFMGSLNPLSPIYGDYHVIDKKYTQLSCFNGKFYDGYMS